MSWARECTRSLDCRSTQVCVVGTCAELCMRDADCLSGAPCRGGVCAFTTDAATADAADAGPAEAAPGDQWAADLDLADISHSDGGLDGNTPDATIADASTIDRTAPDQTSLDLTILDRDAATQDLNDAVLVDSSGAEAASVNDRGQPDQASPELMQADIAPADAYQAQQITLMSETFNGAAIDNRWTVRIDSCTTAAAGTVYHNTSQDVCGTVVGFAQRPYAGDRCMIWQAALDTQGYSDVKLVYWVRNDSNTSIRAYARQAGSWVLVDTAGPVASWTQREVDLTTRTTGLRFDLIAGSDSIRRIDCISITGWL
ncbi:MAG: hypothetical protein ABIJ09_24395 [Pseudomonadota bacterium]